MVLNLKWTVRRGSKHKQTVTVDSSDLFPTNHHCTGMKIIKQTWRRSKTTSTVPTTAGSGICKAVWL